MKIFLEKFSGKTFVDGRYVINIFVRMNFLRQPFFKKVAGMNVVYFIKI